MGLSQKLKNTVKTIFMNYLEFHNTKLEMNLEKVICPSLQASF